MRRETVRVPGSLVRRVIRFLRGCVKRKAGRMAWQLEALLPRQAPATRRRGRRRP
jgi:hypothetical protein